MKGTKKESKDQSIANMLKAGFSYETIRNLLQAGNSRISRISDQIKKNSAIIPAKRGRPPKVNSDVITTIENKTIDDPSIGGYKLSKFIQDNLKIQISPSLINRIRNQLNFHFTHPRRCQFLTPKHIENRITFSQNQLNGDINWCESVIFSDESRFCMHDDSSRIWIKRGLYTENTFCKEKKYEKGIMIWGAIGKNWRSPLVLVNGRLNSDGYIQLLDDSEIFTSLNEHFGENQFFFEQDGAPAHRAIKTCNWISSQKVQLIQDWPANSPDLSCIEQVWSILEKKNQKIYY